jgi:hypothetical protein
MTFDDFAALYMILGCAVVFAGLLFWDHLFWHRKGDTPQRDLTRHYKMQERREKGMTHVVTSRGSI